MPRSKSVPDAKRVSKTTPPATTPDGREKQMIALAVDLAEKQLREGTASAQVITHYLKLGSSREKLEQKAMEEKVKLDAAKIDALQSTKRSEELFDKAIKALGIYRGDESGDPDNVENVQ